MNALQEIVMAPGMAPAADAATAFDALLDVERSRLYGVAYSILRNHAEAEDALQDAMLKAWRSWSSVRDTRAAATWLLRIVVNHCINRRRSAARHPAGAPPAGGEAAPDDPRLAGRLVDLDHAYLRLSPRQRAAIFLHYHHGYSIDECAHLMRCRAGSVRTHLARAISSMRKEMANA